MLIKIISFLCILSLLLCSGCDGGCGPGEKTDLDGDGFTSIEGDCNDADPAVNPSAPEICNGIDDNCDGKIDEGCQWNKIFGGTDDESVVSVISGNNGGYVTAGVVNHYDTGIETGDIGDAWIIKIDKNGYKLWDRTFGRSTFGRTGGDPEIVMANSVIQGNNGGYVIAGEIANMADGGTGWAIKTDENGNELWHQTFGGNRISKVKCVISGNSGGYVIAGKTDYNDAGDGDVCIIKIDENGDELWHQIFGGINYDIASSAVQGNGGGYVVAGFTKSYGAGSNDAWIIKIDENGNELWDKTFGGTDVDMANSIIAGDNGGYVIAGYTKSYGAGYSDAWIIKIDEDGNEQWNKTFGSTGWDEVGSVINGNSGGYVIAGQTNSHNGADAYDFDAWVFKIDVNGNEQWHKTFGGNGDDGAASVISGNNGGYVLAGATSSYGTGGFDSLNAWIIKTDENGNAPASPSNRFFVP